MSHTQQQIRHHAQALINRLREHGVLISPEDLPVILRIGADEFTRLRGKEIPDEDMTVIHLVIQELRTITVPA